MQEHTQTIDIWVKSLTNESAKYVSKVIKLLRSLIQLNESTNFPVPYDAFEKENLSSAVFLPILLQLWRSSVIDLVDLDPTNHSAYGWNKDYEPDNDFNAQTNIYIDMKSFNRLSDLLEGKESKIVSDSTKICLGALVIDTKLAIVRYGKGIQFHISPTDKNINLLIILIKHKPDLVSYMDLAKELKVKNFSEFIGNKDCARDIQSIRRDLGRFLKRHLGKKANEINRLVLSVRNEGYKISDETINSEM